MGGYRDDHLWETQIREIDENGNVSVSNIGKLFTNDAPKLRPRFTFPNGERRIEVIREMRTAMNEFVQNLGERSFNMDGHIYAGDSLPTQQAKVAGRTAVAATLYRIWRLLERELKTEITANLVKVKNFYTS